MTGVEPLSPNGAVIWITGLSGSGKSTVARALLQRLKSAHTWLALLDGDELRPIIAPDLGYSFEERIACAARYAGLARLLARQGACVVIATISMEEGIRRRNREALPGYFEIYLKASPQLLATRSPLFNAALRGKQEAVVGVDIAWEEPKSPDLIVPLQEETTVREVVDLIWARFSQRAARAD
jgi:adenylylsulfate kinase-like enzyme